MPGDLTFARLPDQEPNPTAPVRLSNAATLLEMIRLAAPTVATMASYTLMQFMDGMMVAHMQPASPDYIAAQGNGGIWAWTPISILAGCIGVVSTYVSQNLGAGQPQRGSAYAWAGLWISLGYWLALLLPFALLLPWIFGTVFPLLGAELPPRVIDLQTQYAQVMLAFAPFALFTRVMAQYFYGLHRPMVVFAAAIAGNLVNLMGNSLLIYGPSVPQTGWAVLDWWFGMTSALAAGLGLAPMGVLGAAIATVAGSAVEMLVPLAVFLSPKFERAYGTRSAWRPSGGHVRDILKLGWPAALMHGNEMICWAIFMTVLAGGFGPDHNAAAWIALRYMHLSFMPAVGISFAASAMVGKAMGAGDPAEAARRAWLSVGVTMAYMGACAVAFVAFREPLVGLFVAEDLGPDRQAAILKIGMQVMVLAAAFQLFDAMGITIVGALRGAGDTVVPGVVTMVLAWTVLVGGGYGVVHLAPQWESLGPWGAAAAYIIFFGLFAVHRFARGHWKTLRLLETSASARHG